MKALIPFAVAILFLTSCKKDDPEPAVVIDAATLELKYDKTHQFVLSKGSESITASSYTWKSSDEKIGKVDANGVFTARKIGETKITAASGASGAVESTIKVIPYSTFLTEPVVQWGADANTVKGKEKRKLSTLSTAEFLVYEGDNANVALVGYLFESGKLIASIVAFTSTSQAALNASIAESSTFYQERYPNIEQDNNAVYITNDEETFGIILSIDQNLGYNAEYVPLKKGGRRDAEATEKLQKALKNLNIK